MADYDPANPVFDATDEGYDNGEYQYDQQEAAEEEDDDYDPSSFNFEDDSGDAQLMEESNHTQTDPTNPTTAVADLGEQNSKPRTFGGFVVEDDDEDEDEEEQDVVPPPSQIDGIEGAQSGLGAVAVVEAAAQDVPPIASEPQDTAAVLSAVQTDQSTRLNGSVPVIPVSDIPTSPSTTLAPAPDPAPASSFQKSISIADQGKPGEYLSTAAASAPQSATATPQPPPAAAPPPAQTNGSVPPTPTTQRLPHDKVGQLEDRIGEDPKADTDAWRSLIAHYREKGQLEQARKMYGRFFEVFPSAASKWVEYAQMEIEQDVLPLVEQIFSNCLLTLPNVDMWSTYLDYLRRIHLLINDSDGSKRAIISSAFELLLDNVGIDPDSGKLWREYVDFIKSGPGVMGGPGWQDAQKMDLLRKAYQRAIKLPHGELTKLWKEYDNFELGLNKATGRKYLTEQSPYYMTARTAKTQLDQKIEYLDRTSLPKLPPLHGCSGEDGFATQVETWRAWLEWEKEDPLVLKDEDIAAYRKRIIYVYKQATMQLRFYPGIWFEAATWCLEQGPDEMTKEGERFLDEGMAACPESVLLALKKADRLESGLEAGNTDELAVANGKKLEEPYENVLTTLYALRLKMLERTKMAVGQVREYFANLPPEEEPDAAVAEDDDDDDDDEPGDEKPKNRAQQLEAEVKAVQATSSQQTDALKRTISYIWVAKMRAFRRIQGQGNPKEPEKKPKGFRGIFSEARPRGQLTSEVYIASALMEWHCYKDQSANKIFERGLRLFPIDEVFALEYIKHLISINDHTNARVVFETTITKIMNTPNTPLDQQRAKCRPLFAFMHHFESKYSDNLDKIHRLEKRMAEMFPDEPDVLRFSDRFALPSFDAMQVQLVISPTQALPKSAGHFAPAVAPFQQPMRSIEQPRSPPEIILGPNGPYVASPKRRLDDSDSEAPQRKFMRGESPLKGAAGRRMQNVQISGAGQPAGGAVGGAAAGGGFVTKIFVPGAQAVASQSAGPAPLPRDVNFLLSIIPSATSYRAVQFDPVRMVDFLRTVNIDGARARLGGT